MKFFQICRAKCTAPARYLRDGKCVFISAMCNDIGIDEAVPATGGEKYLPLPTMSEMLKQWLLKFSVV